MIFPLWFCRAVAVLDVAAFLYWSFKGNAGWAIYFLVCGLFCLMPDVVSYLFEKYVKR